MRLKHARAAYEIMIRKGVGSLFLSAALYMSERHYERWFGIRTGGNIVLKGIHDTDDLSYCASNYTAFFKATKFLDREDFEGAFVDYGAGLGRIVCCAATLPFNRVIGIELSDDLAQAGRRNLEIARRRFHCKTIELLTMDAANWTVPADATVFHFYNPFLNRVLIAVISALAESLRCAPRRVALMCSCSKQIEQILRTGELIPRGWIAETIHIKWPFRGHNEPEKEQYRIYRLDSRRADP